MLRFMVIVITYFGISRCVMAQSELSEFSKRLNAWTEWSESVSTWHPKITTYRPENPAEKNEQIVRREGDDYFALDLTYMRKGKIVVSKLISNPQYCTELRQGLNRIGSLPSLPCKVLSNTTSLLAKG